MKLGSFEAVQGSIEVGWFGVAPLPPAELTLLALFPRRPLSISSCRWMNRRRCHFHAVDFASPTVFCLLADVVFLGGSDVGEEMMRKQDGRGESESEGRAAHGRVCV